MFSSRHALASARALLSCKWKLYDVRNYISTYLLPPSPSPRNVFNNHLKTHSSRPRHGDSCVVHLTAFWQASLEITTAASIPSILQASVTCTGNVLLLFSSSVRARCRGPMGFAWKMKHIRANGAHEALNCGCIPCLSLWHPFWLELLRLCCNVVMFEGWRGYGRIKPASYTV